MVHAARGDAVLGSGNPGVRVDVGLAVAHVGLLGVELDEVAGRDLEAHALAGFEHLTGGNALGGEAEGLEVAVELLEGGLVGNLEGEEIDAGLLGLTDQDAVVIALVPGLEIHAALVVTAGFDQTQGVLVKVDAFFQIQDAQRNVAGTQNTSHCHKNLLQVCLPG